MLQPTRDWVARGGVPVSDPWVDPAFTQLPGACEEFIAADCLTMNTEADGFIISEAARKVLGPLLGGAAEFWPTQVLGLPYQWLNCIGLVAALDRAATDADWSVVEGDWGSFRWISSTRRLEFRRDRLADTPALFRIPEYPQGVLFVTDEFKNAVAEHELTGFKFDEVWSSTRGGVFDPAGLGFKGMFDPVPRMEVERKRQAAREMLRRRAAE